MKIKKFNEEYKNNGGIYALTEMTAFLNTQDSIAKHFGVVKERIRQWNKEFFGETYDPRYERRDLIIERMIQFYNKNTIEEFKEAYSGTEYYKEVLKTVMKNKKNI